ncbi:Na+/H+ antiporter NhaA [Microbacteriaceae bacterium VKM Ac-2855]|nr:Na+/H+ antiporter NhaA [Microbacteriaceae bacterium VKM Ac-2855]
MTTRTSALRRILREERTGGALLLAATLLALVLANSPAADVYAGIRDFQVGPAALHLELSLGAWAADGLLAIFFFVVGLELKQEFVVGRLRDARTAILPIAAAVGGVAVPALIYLAFTAGVGADATRGWAVPVATDIAFAVAVLAVVGRGLPPALRTFLLTLAVVDDLLAITIIAVFYTAQITVLPLVLAIVPLVLFALAVRRGVRAWWLLLPLAVTTWALVHASGIHATVAGVLLGFVVPVVATSRARVPDGTDAQGAPRYSGLAHHFAERWGTLSTLVAVPIFAFFSAGVAVGGLSGLASAFEDRITLGIVAGLVLGKAIGITGTTFLLTRLPGLRLDPSLRWRELIGMAFVAGIGFTVSLLVAELSFGNGTLADDHAKVGVLTGSLIAALLGGSILSIAGRRPRV